MFCPGCGAANVDGAKFCGSCGFRLDPTPVPAPAVAPAPPSAASVASATTPTVVRMPQALEPSAASLAPVRGGRGGRLAIVLGVDAALVVAGVVLWTRPPSPAAAPAVAVVEPGGSGSGSAPPPTTFVEPGSGSAKGGHGGGAAGGGGGNVTPGGGGNPSGSGSSGNVGGGSGTSSGTGAPAGAIDARSLDDRLTDAASAAIGDVDAGGGAAPAVDAAEAAATEPDAAADPAGEVDASVGDDEVSAAVIQSQFARLGVTSESRFSRCYQSATKALPDDQPLVGKLDISLAVMPTGRTENVRVDVNTTGSQTLATCIVGVIGSWQFSPHDGTAPLQFSKSIDFKPQ